MTRRRLARRVGGTVIALAAVSPVIGGDGAQAATVTVGSPLTAGTSGSFGGIATEANVALGEPGAQVASPVNGTIVSYRAKLGDVGRVAIRALRPAGAGAFTGAGSSTPATPPGTGLQTFSANLPIRAGDLVGLDLVDPSSNIEQGVVSGSTVDEWGNPGLLADGATAPPANVYPNFELAFNADVRPQPGITSISPVLGSPKGGTQVTIVGHDFIGTTALSFGNAPAASFSVSSDSQITAVTPAERTGTVDVTVSNPAQSPAVAADRFSFGCLVPNLRAKSLRKSRKRLRRAGCRLGTVKGPRSGRVKKQRPKPGRLVAPDTRVKVKLR